MCNNAPIKIGYRRYYPLENDTGFGENPGPFLMILETDFFDAFGEVTFSCSSSELGPGRGSLWRSGRGGFRLKVLGETG